MKISYAITVCNEGREFRNLLDFLIPRIRPEDEIVVLQDTSKTSEEVNRIFIDTADYVQTRVTSNFGGDFAAWKNTLNSYCKGNYIFQLDADELPSELLLKLLPTVLDRNPEVDIYAIPRDNRVTGITEQDIQRWGWKLDGKGRVNWPDYQWRIYRNCAEIKWQGRVHEKPVGFKKYAVLPENLYLQHNKTIQKQREQNSFYDTLQ